MFSDQPQRLTALLAHKFPDQNYWIEPYILPKNGKMIIAAQAKAGKSMSMISLARDLALGEPLFGNKAWRIPRPTKILYLEQEIGPLGVQERMAKVFKPYELPKIEDLFWYISKQPSLEFTTPDGFARICDRVAAAQPEVLILDPIGKMHTFDENHAQGISILMQRLDKLLLIGQAWGMSMVVSHHFGKPSKLVGANDVTLDSLDPYQMRGSSKFYDDPDTLVTAKYLKQLATPHRAWKVLTRWIFRRGEGFDDTVLSVNKNNDLRVFFEEHLSITGVPRVGSAGTPPPAVALGPGIKTFG